MITWISKTLKNTHENILLIRHLFPVLMKVQMGRWFVFRDTPTWVVKKIAEKKPIPNNVLDEKLIHEAAQELRLRQQQ